MLRSRGGVWHQKHREKGEVPHTSIDTEAHWTKSGWHGWVYGWKLHVVSIVAAVWFPLVAVLTPANIADSEPAPALLREAPAEVRFILGDRHYNTPDLHKDCAQADRLLVTTRYGRYPHTDGGVEVRRVFHKLGSIAMENFNEHFKGIFDGHGQVLVLPYSMVVLFSVIVTSTYSHRVHSLHAVERLSQPSSHDDGKPSDDEGSPQLLMMLMAQNVHLSLEKASPLCAGWDYSSIGCFSGMNQSGIIKSWGEP